MDFLTLEKFGVGPELSALAGLADEHSLTNVFNASVAVHDGASYVAFRAESFPGERPFRAYVAQFVPGQPAVLIDLTAQGGAMEITKTADPKLVTLNNELYVTFNTGNVHSGENAIYLQQLTPRIGPPQRCTFDQRRMVEKNWGFFSLPDGEIGILYSLVPTRTLRLVRGVPGTEADLVFEAHREADVPTRFPRLHIGSQPFLTTGTRALVAANQQRPIPGLPRKIYFGRLSEVDLHTGEVLRLSQRGLIHSWRSMLPQRKRHNPGLFSATYFAGLALTEHELLLSYGINDTGLGIARVPQDLAWR